MNTKLTLAAITLILVSSVASAQAPKNYSCRALDGNQPGLGGISHGQTKQQAETTFLEFVKQYGVTKVSCIVMPRQGNINDLVGKKWGFQGLKNNETYLVFKDGQISHIQECGSNKVIQKFNAEIVGEKSLKLTQAGSEGLEESCNPYYVAGFKTGSIVSFQLMIYEGEPAALLLTDKRPGEEISYTSLYKEIRE